MGSYSLLVLYVLVVSVSVTNCLKDDCIFLGKRVKASETLMQFPLENEPGYCNGFVCANSRITFYPLFKCQVSSVKRMTPKPEGCLADDGHGVQIGGTISSGVDVNGCQFAKVCTAIDTVSIIHESGCPTTTIPTTTLGAPSGYCFYNGQYYSPGTEIERGQSGNWCYFTFCDSSGNIINGDDFHCNTTPTTARPTTVPVIPIG